MKAKCALRATVTADKKAAPDITTVFISTPITSSSTIKVTNHSSRDIIRNTVEAMLA